MVSEVSFSCIYNRWVNIVATIYCMLEKYGGPPKKNHIKEELRTSK